MTNLQKSTKQIFRFAMNAAHPSAVLSNLRSAKFRSWPLLLNFAFVTSNPSCGFLGGGSIGGVVFIRPNLICLDNKQNLIRKRSSLLDYGLLFGVLQFLTMSCKAIIVMTIMTMTTIMNELELMSSFCHDAKGASSSIPPLPPLRRNCKRF